MRRLILAIALVALVVSVATATRSVTGTGIEETTQNLQLSELQTRVSVLETQVATSTPIEAYTITGTVNLPQAADGLSAFNETETGCVGIGQYADLQIGAQAVVRDSSATTIAEGTVTSAQITEDNTCLFAFVINDVPHVPWYLIMVGVRTSPLYQFDEISGLNWSVNFTIVLD